MNGDGYTNFIDDRHALYVGWLVGTANRAGILLEPMTDSNDNYTDMVSLPVFDGKRVQLIVPPPPDDWRL